MLLGHHGSQQKQGWHPSVHAISSSQCTQGTLTRGTLGVQVTCGGDSTLSRFSREVPYGESWAPPAQHLIWLGAPQTWAAWAWWHERRLPGLQEKKGGVGLEL